MAKSFKMLDNEFWWGGTVVDACNMPYSKDTDTVIDLTGFSRILTIE